MATLQHFSLEFLPNIRQLVILIPVHATTTEFTAKIFLNRKTKRLFTGESSIDSELLISVPGRIDLDSLDLPICGSEVENFPQTNRIDNVVVLQFRNVVLDCQSSALEDLVTAKTLQTSCTSFSCSTCTHVLKHFSPDEFNFKDLPNEHWLELLDCWSCHDNEFAPIAERALNQKLPIDHHNCNGHEHEHEKRKASSYQDINNSSNGLILPPPGRIYLGVAHILINKQDFSLPNCPQCKAQLSEPVQDAHIKMYRDAITFNYTNSSHESFTTILMHRILDTIDNHSTFHFILKSTGRDPIYLRPINWNLRVCDRVLGKWRAAFKLGYTQSQAANSDAEIIHCTPQQYDETVKSLNSLHTDALFGSSIKMPGSTETLKLSYLIN